MSVPIEDLCEDILGKSQAGLNLSNRDLCEKSEIDRHSLDALKSGEFNEPALRKIAAYLHLDADALVISGKKEWYPHSVAVEGLACFNSPYPVPGYSEMTVNAYSVWDADTNEAAIFDSGADASSILDKTSQLNLTVKVILLTHAHGDHITDLKRLKKKTGNPPTYINRLEPTSGADSIDEGWETTVGSLNISALLTNGHSPGGTTYLITGLDSPLAITGDSLFAGSIGGAASHYNKALENNRKKILTLPDDTVICPGHGPLSTVGEEKAHNPFFPEFK